MEETVIGGPGSQPLDIAADPNTRPAPKPAPKKVKSKTPPPKEKKMPPKPIPKKVAAKKAVALPVSAIAAARKKAAQMQLKSGDRVTLSSVVAEAIEKFCK